MAAVTFDDAYVDVLKHGLPILERFEVPAPVFVVTASLGEPFWWGRLAALLHCAEPLRRLPQQRGPRRIRQRPGHARSLRRMPATMPGSNPVT
jgi:hypothetical protein